MIIFFLSCAHQGERLPQLLSKTEEHHLYRAAFSPDEPTRARSFEVILSSSSQERADWIPITLEQESLFLRRTALSSLAKSGELPVDVFNHLSLGDRCWFLLESEQELEFKPALSELNRLEAEERFTCFVYLHRTGNSDPLVKLLSSDILTSIVYPYEALAKFMDPSIEAAMNEAYFNGLDSYQVTLLMAWLCGASKSAQSIFEEQLSALDDEGVLEQVELILRFEPEQIKPLLQKIDRRSQTPYAKLGLVSIAQASETIAIRALLDVDSSRTVREMAARSLGRWLDVQSAKKQRSNAIRAVEDALREALTDDDPRVQIAAIYALGFASSRALSWLQSLEVDDAEAKVEIIASIRRQTLKNK